MNFLTAKEQRVENAWNKRGLAGLRSELLMRTEEDSSDHDFVLIVSVIVFGRLPARLWKNAEQIIKETCGLRDIDISDHSELLMKSRLSEETLREDIGDE